MKVNLIKLPFFLLLITLSACTDIIQISEDSIPDEILVVEGEITDQSGPYTVKLSTTTSLDGLGSNTLGRNAEVIIEEVGGKEEVLRETNPGIYQTNIGGIQGEIGKSYRVKITLANGNEYQSEFESIPEPVEILSVSAEFIDERFKINGEPQRTIGHKISAQMTKNPAVQKFFKFEAEGIQEVEVLFDEMICPFPINQTPLCYTPRSPLQNQIEIFNDSDIAKDDYSLDVVIIPVEQRRRYLAKIEAHSFSSKTYNFWSAVKGQLDKKGNIFDSPIPPVIGNVKNINTNSFAQGYFAAASVSSRQICINRSDAFISIELPLSCIDSNCTQIWAPATYAMPDFGFCQ